MTSQEFLESIRKVSDVNEHYQFINSLVNTDNEKLISIFDLIPKDWHFLLQNWQLRAAYEKIINAICRNSDQNSISTASIIFRKLDRKLDKLKMASMLASFHTSDILIDELLLHKNDELLILAVHEFVSRGIDLRESKRYDFLETINKKTEFKRLCLFPLEQELKNSFPTYSENGSGYGFSFGFADEEEYEILAEVEGENMLLKKQEEIVEAIDHWVEMSGGISIGYRGIKNRHHALESIIKDVPELSKAEKLRIKKLNSTTAFQRIFDASSKGAAYSYGNMGAYGRLKSWKSIHSMMSDEKMESNELTSELMKEFDWFEFNTDDWFINEWCDFGLICLNCNTGAFGLIAGTDTD